MRETAIVDRIRQLAAASQRGGPVRLGIGDDCAVMKPRSGEELVFTTDLALEGRHFERATHSPGEIGHKALARSLSDLAAMGSEPVFFLVSLALPAGLAPRWVRSFYRGLLALANRYNIVLAGGDLSRFDKIVIDVMCCGRVPAGKAMLRSNAKPGDRIYVTGELGASSRGLISRRGAAWKRHRRPEPRIGVGLALRRLGVTAAMDISDGLSLDLRRLCRESKVSAELSGALPIAPGATLEDALHGGEDYELLFTAPRSKRMLLRVEDVSITCIGEITNGVAGRVRYEGKLLPSGGFDHFE